VISWAELTERGRAYLGAHPAAAAVMLRKNFYKRHLYR